MGNAFVMRSTVYWELLSIVSNERIYAAIVSDMVGNRTLLGYPVHLCAKSGATATGEKSIFFGNWQYVAYRESPSLTLRRIPSAANPGQIRLYWNYRTVYGVVIPEAIGYAVHP